MKIPIYVYNNKLPIISFLLLYINIPICCFVVLLIFQNDRGTALLPLTQALINLKEQQEIADNQVSPSFI